MPTSVTQLKSDGFASLIPNLFFWISELVWRHSFHGNEWGTIAHKKIWTSFYAFIQKEHAITFTFFNWPKQVTWQNPNQRCEKYYSLPPPFHTYISLVEGTEKSYINGHETREVWAIRLSNMINHRNTLWKSVINVLRHFVFM